MKDKTLKKRMEERADTLKKLRDPFDKHYEEIGRNFATRRSRFSQAKGKAHRSDEGFNKHILNSKPIVAARTLKSGLHSGITSPARPWFRITPYDRELRKFANVSEHFGSAQRFMRQRLRGSSIYGALHQTWGDLALFGHDAMIVEEDGEGGLHAQPLVPGEFWIAVNGRGMADTVYREVDLTLYHVVTKFVYRNDPRGTPDWSVVDQATRNMWNNGQTHSLVPVHHLIQPRLERDPRFITPQNKAHRSTYWQPDGRDGVLLGDLGYDKSPLIASRWEAEGTNTYGSSPAMDALSDARELQRQERDKAESIRRGNRPPMNAPLELRNSPFSLMPEAVNFMADPSKGLVPAFTVDPPINEMVADIANTEHRLDVAMYADLFMMIANLDRSVTATEIDVSHEERLLALGPVLERQDREKLGQLLAMVYEFEIEAGTVEPLNAEFGGVKAAVDYVSTLGMAQKAVATGGIERLYAFAGNIAGVDGSIMDKLDNDEALDEYADMLGTPTRLLRPQAEVSQVREDRQRQVEEAQNLERAQQAASAAKDGAGAAQLLAATDQGGRTGDTLSQIGLRN